MYRLLFILFLFCLSCTTSQVKNSTVQKLNTVNIQQLDSILLKDPKPVVFFFHTEWCKYCLQMEKTTLKNQRVIDLLNEHFHFVSFDAESTEKVSFLGKTFAYQPTGANTGLHDLAKQLATIKGKISYPTVSILNVNHEIVFQHGGVLDAEELVAVLREVRNQ